MKNIPLRLYSAEVDGCWHMSWFQRNDNNNNDNNNKTIIQNALRRR